MLERISRARNRKQEQHNKTKQTTKQNDKTKCAVADSVAGPVALQRRGATLLRLAAAVHRRTTFLVNLFSDNKYSHELSLQLLHPDNISSILLHAVFLQGLGINAIGRPFNE